MEDINFNKLLSAFDNTSVKYLELVLPYSIDHFEYFQNLENMPRLGLVTFHGAPQDMIINDTVGGWNIICGQAKVLSVKDTFHLSPDYLRINSRLYLETLNHNTYYHKKLSINESGDLKNCNSLKNVFGNILTDELRPIILSKIFQLLWSAKKDITKKCKSCELRYMCIYSNDIRKNKNGEWENMIDCSYNPKTATWNWNKSSKHNTEEIEDAINISI